MYEKEERCLGCMEIYQSFDAICPHCGYINGSPPDEMYHLHPGTVLQKRYLLGKVLGFGGFGITYIGWDKTLLRKVAIKEYLPGECSTRIPGNKTITIFEGEKQTQFREGIETFLDEARKLMKFQNLEGIVKIYDCFEENATAYIVMECLEGETLSSMLKRKGKLQIEETLNMALPMIQALKEVHSTGIIHRDIAPDNIFVTKDSTVKLLDFGSARYIALAQSKSLSVIIKPGYAPPEQYQTHGNQGPWTDVYSLAATIYRMLTGVVPEDAMERLAEDNLLPPSKLGVHLLKDQEIALLNALNTVVASRTQTMEEFEKQLLSIKSVVRQKDGKIGKAKAEKRTVFKISAAALMIVVLVIGSLFVSGTVRIGGMNSQSHIDYGTGLVGNYTGTYYDEVAQEAEENGINLEVIDTINTMDDLSLTDDTIGKVLEQIPAAGTSLEETDGVIQVVLSAGTKKSTIENFLGYPQEEAKKQAGNDSFRLTIEKDAISSNVIPGYITSQTADGGTKIPKGSMVKMTISAGNPSTNASTSVAMPSLKGKTFKEALKVAKKKGFYLGIKEHKYSLDSKKGTICAQSSKAKEKIAGGTNVLVTISDGPEPMKVPDVIGMELANAQEALTGQKLKYTVNYEYNDNYGSSYSSGQVMTQSVQAGTTVDEGTEITLTVSQGAKPVEKKSTKPSSGGSSKKSTRQKKNESKRKGYEDIPEIILK